MACWRWSDGCERGGQAYWYYQGLGWRPPVTGVLTPQYYRKVATPQYDRKVATTQYDRKVATLGVLTPDYERRWRRPSMTVR